MTDPGFGRLKEILSRALDLPEAERAAYLDAACGTDVFGRKDVEQEGHMGHVLIRIGLELGNRPHRQPEFGI